jgi:hypothetical protein
MDGFDVPQGDGQDQGLNKVASILLVSLKQANREANFELDTRREQVCNASHYQSAC